MDDIDEELTEIKREIVESRGLVIKTNNLTSALAADLRTITKRQQSFERRAFFNSAFVFVLFVAVVIGAVYVAWNARVDSMSRETKESKDKADRAHQEVEGLKKEIADRAAAESAASAYYELIRAGRRREVIDGYKKIRDLPLSRAELSFFSDAVDKAKGDLSVESYQAGLDHTRGGRWNEATKAFEEAIALSPTGSHTPSAELELARALRRLNRSKEAVAILSRLSESSPNPEILDDATFLLAECLVDIQAYNDARSTYRSFIRRFPDSLLVNDAKMALEELKLKK
ncbi:MAG: tetratricopeptide repeat protein [Polyangiaceae bacterium]|nr:tetratricopeptide repeat protein [Polyangiaceae bacterium]